MYPENANSPVLCLDAGPALAPEPAPDVCLAPGIPEGAESALADLYGSFYASLPQLEIESGTHGVQSYAEYRNGKLTELWLYRIESAAVRVLNEAIPVHAATVERFARAVFTAHPDTGMLLFNAIYPQGDRLALPHLRMHGSDDCVLTLPASEEAYLAALGKATRKNMKRYLNRFKEAFPSFRYEVVEGAAVSADLLGAVVALNRERMAAKGKVSGIDAAEEARMLQLVHRCGFVGAGTIDGKVCAGAVVYRSGNNYFSFVRAHDPAYNDYRLGLIGAWHLVCTCIARGGRELHFMWGKEPHKALLGGEQRVLERMLVFRSRARMLRHADAALRHLSDAWARRTRQYMFERARRDDRLGHMLATTLAHARRIKRRLHP